MKKFKIAFIIISFCIMISSICFAETVGNASATLATQINVNYDEKNIELKNANDEVIYPIMYKDRTYLPIEPIAFIANTSFEWNEKLKSVYLSSNSDTQKSDFEERTDTLNENQSIDVLIDNEIKIYYDDELQNLIDENGIKIEPLIYNDTIYLTFRYLVDLFNIEAEWNAETYTITLLKNNDKSTEVYSDIAGTPYEGVIEALTELGIINGYEDGTFKPLNSVNRAEYTKLLVVATGLEPATDVNKGATKFSDVGAEHWACGYINIADEYGYISGYSDGTFRPNNAITYEEAIMYTVNALGYKYALEEAYITKAEEIKLVDKLVFTSYDDELTRGNACILLWNMLRTEMWDIENGNGKIKLEVPRINGLYFYTGYEQTVRLSFFDSNTMNISGDKRTIVGEQDVIISLKDKEKYEWKDGTTEDKILKWNIEKKIIRIPSITAREYNGEEITCDFFVGDGEYIEKYLVSISGNKAMEIGSYEAIISLRNKECTEWNNGTTDDKIILWEITKGKLEVPYQDFYYGEVLEYNGKEQEAILKEFEEDLMTITGNKATKVGNYKATVSLKDKEHYQWKIFNAENKTMEYTTEDQEIEWKITKKDLTIPTLMNNSQYNGKEQKIKLRNFDESIMNITNGVATEIGKYKAIISLKDKNNYQWEKGGTEDITISWSITQGILGIPGVYSSSSSNRYTGQEQQACIEGFDDTLMNITGNIATEVGTYKAIISIKDKTKYQWKNGTTEDVILTWHIKKASCDIEIVNRNLILGEELKVLITPNITDGTIIIWYEEKNNGGVYYENQLPTETGLYKVKIQVINDKNLSETTKEEYIFIEEAKNNSNTNSTSSTSSSRGGGSSSSTKTYKATITQATGGTIAVNESEVEKGDKQVFVIMADEGYKIVDVKVDGKSVGAVNTYTIEEVTKKHTITATFEKLTEEELKELEESKESTWVNTFEDVTTNDWYYEAVKFVNEAGLFKGLSDTEFGANVTMNRAMIVTVLHRLAGETKVQDSNISFSDISNEEYYSNAVIWAVENGIVNGVGNNDFAPQDDVTREQLIVMLYRYAKLTGNLTEEKANLSAYDDVDLISDYAKEAFAWAIQEGIITGRTTTTLAPKGIATRAEVATMIMRFSTMINNTAKNN